MIEIIRAPIFSALSFFYYHLVETSLFAGLIAFFFFRRRKPTEKELLTEEQKDEIIANWKPEPLVAPIDPSHPCLNPKIVDGKMGKYVKIADRDYVNFATNNYLGFVGDKRIEEAAKSTIFKYGVGSCGPRSFYGTVDVHLALERQLADFMHCEEAVLYSYGFATIASAIPAYAKRGDIIYVDKAVNYAIQTGIQASRSRIEWFEHNDMDHLESLLKAQAKKDAKNSKAAAKIRRFIIVEGLYAKTADFCPLKRIIELKWRYKNRVFVDESLSFGVIGATGRGVTEHFGVDIIDVDMTMVSLENAIASTGGFCCGRTFVMEHQRLSGLGYCFSASLPPLLTVAAGVAVRIINEEPGRIERLHANTRRLHRCLETACEGTAFGVCGAEISPLKHLFHRTDDETKLDAVVEKLFEAGVLVTRACYLLQNEMFAPRPSVKIMCNSEISIEEFECVTAKFGTILRNINSA